MFKTILLSLFLVGSHHFETVTPTPSPTINQAPQLKGYEIGTQTGTEDEVFEFDVPVEDIFYDDNELAYSANEATKEALPKWLAFNDESYSFFGLPSDTDIGRYNISLTATDQGGLEASTYFLIEIMGQSENKDTLSSGDITGIILGLLAAISPCIVDGIAYARWRIKKKTEEEDDGPSSLLTCENYRSECCKGNFKFLNCYNKCDGCCSTIFSCLCDDCCKACCKEDSCNCCVSSYHHPSRNDEKSLEKHHTNNEQNLTVGGNVTASNGGKVNIHNSKKINNSTQNTHVKNDHRSQVTNHYYPPVQVVKEEENTTSNQRLELEKLKIEIENLRNQLKDKDTKLSEKSQQLHELKFSLKEKDLNHQHKLKEKDQKIQEYTNELNNKKERIETLSNQLKDKDTKLDEKSQQLNELKSTLKESSVNHQQELKKKDQEIQVIKNKLNNKNERIENLSNQLKDKDTKLDEKNEHINMLNKEVNKKDSQLNDKDNTISSLNNQLKAKDQKIAELQKLLEEEEEKNRLPLDYNKQKELFKAIENNNIKKVKMFLYTYKDVLNAKDDGWRQMTPFLFAAKNGHLEIAKLLKERGANINATDNHSRNALHKACRYSGSVEMVTWLLDVCKIDIDIEVMPKNEIKKHYFDQWDIWVRTPFLYAAGNGRLAIAKLLKERGANVHAKDEDGNNALHKACLFSDNVTMVIWLLDECKLDIEAKGQYERTPFILAAWEGHVATAKLLKERGANIYEKDEKGNNALHMACFKSGSVEMVTWLLEKCKIDIESKQEEKMTPFLCAAWGGQLAIAKLLKERGANVHATSKDGKNALQLTSSWGKEMISYLKSLGLR